MIEYDEEDFIDWDDYDHEPWSDLELVDDDADYLYYEDECGSIIRKEKCQYDYEDEESEERHHGVL